MAPQRLMTTPAQTPTPTTTADATNAAADSSVDPILMRLKQLEETNEKMRGSLEQANEEVKRYKERNEFLSADKRKEMQALIESGIDKWLNALTGMSEENRKQFRTGIEEMAKKADMNNTAWELVCNASATHETNVRRIEELIQKDAENQRTIDELRGFKTEASRIGGPATLGKRAREEGDLVGTIPPVVKRADAWNEFETMLRGDFAQSNYGSVAVPRS